MNAGLLDQIAGAACGQDLETAVIKDLSDFRNFRLILLVDGDQDCSLCGKCRVSAFLCLEVSLTGLGRDTEHLAGRTHLRAEQGIDFLEHIEGEYCLLDAIVRDGSLTKRSYR